MAQVTLDVMTPTLDYPWSQPPAPGTTIDVAPGVKWLRMPLPFQLDHINLWLVDDGAGWAVVDTGVGLADVRALWERVFPDHLEGRPITRVIVTHFHPDHMGNAAWLMERWAVELWCAQAEYLIGQVAWRTGEARDNEPRLRHYRRNGCGEEALAGLRQRGNHYPRLVPAMPTAFRAIADGDVLTVGGRRWQVIVGRGHSPEHACLYAPALNVLISGDQLLPTISSNVSVYPTEPAANPLAEWLESLAGMKQRIPEDVLVLPAHGKPFRGAHERLQRLIDEHHGCLQDLERHCAQPKRAVDVFPALFRSPIDNNNLIMATGEAIAHLNYLLNQGRMEKDIDDEGIAWYRTAGS